MASYTFLVFGGNNSGLFREALRRRSWWKNSVEDDGEMFVETPDEIEPTALQKRRSEILRIREEEEAVLQSQEFDFCWNSTLGLKLRNGSVVNLHGLEYPGTRPQLVNHFSTIRCLTVKTGLLRSLVTFYNAAGLDPFEVTPTTFIVKNARSAQRGDGSDYSAFLLRFKELGKGVYGNERLPAKHCVRNMWIVKPAALNQGRGIQVFSEIGKIKQHLHNVPDDEEWLVQKYIERPFLLWGRKFDFRIWILVTGAYDIYMYEDGYLRTSSEQFTLELRGTKAGADAKMVHLTNYCMQKHSKNLGKFEEGNTLKLDDLQSYIDENFPDVRVSVRLDIMARMKEMVLDSLLSVRNSIDTANKGRQAFELFGYDFMLDEDFRVWLIEVNTNPYLGVQNPWHGDLLARMTEDCVRLAIDPVFPPPPGVPIPPTPKSVVAPIPMSPILTSAEGAEGGVPPISLGPTAAPPTVASKPKRANGWELLYTERSAEAMAATKHQRGIAADTIPLSEMPGLADGPGSKPTPYTLSGHRKLRRRSASWHYPAGLPKAVPLPTPAPTHPSDVEFTSDSIALRRGPRKGASERVLTVASSEPPQPTPFDYVSSLSAEDRVVWCIDMMSALFTSRGSSILVSALSMGGGRVTARPASADLDTSLDSLGSSCELDSSMDSVQMKRLGSAGAPSSRLTALASPVVASRTLSTGATRVKSARPVASAARSGLASYQPDKSSASAVTGADYAMTWMFTPPLPGTEAPEPPVQAPEPSSPGADTGKAAEEAPAAALPARLAPNDIGSCDIATQRKAMAVCMRYLHKASKDYKLQHALAKSAFCVMAWEVMAAFAKLGRGVGGKGGIGRLVSDTLAVSAEDSLANMLNAFRKHAKVQRDILFPPVTSLVTFAVLPAVAAACEVAPVPPAEAPALPPSPVAAGGLCVLDEGQEYPAEEVERSSSLPAGAIEAALEDVGSMEMSLCVAAYRFLSYVTEKGKLIDSSRKLVMVAGTLHAALFGSLAYPQSSGLRRLALELLRNFRRKDLDELSFHLKCHDKLKPSTVTSAGCVFCTPSDVPFPAHMQTATFIQVVTASLDAELELRNKQVLRSSKLLVVKDDRPTLPKREPVKRALSERAPSKRVSAPAPLSVAAAVADLVTMAEAAALSGAAVLFLAAKTKKSPSKKVKKQGSSGKLGAKEKRKENIEKKKDGEEGKPKAADVLSGVFVPALDPPRVTSKSGPSPKPAMSLPPLSTGPPKSAKPVTTPAEAALPVVDESAVTVSKKLPPTPDRRSMSLSLSGVELMSGESSDGKGTGRKPSPPASPAKQPADA